MSDSPGVTRVGSYSIVAELGRGGMGVVYRARDEQLGRDVAIKSLPLDVARRDEQLELLKREARLLASLNHPNIGMIYGIEETTDACFLILEFVHGQTLGERLSQGPLPVEEALSVGLQVARGVEAAHARHVIHRDLKPDNVMLTGDGVVKVLDFGLAAEVEPPKPEEETSAFARTRTMTVPGAGSNDGVIVGTPRYMSPEQAQAEPCDYRTDVWSFGCVLYECLTGHPVFTGSNAMAAVASVLKDDPDWTALPSDTPAAVRTLLEQCLRKDRDERTAEMQEVRIALSALEQRLETRPDGASARAVVAGNLPRQPTPLFGREDAVAELHQLAGTTTLLTLTGPGGSGKTRLACRLAEERRPRGGSWFVELTTLKEGKQVAQELVRVLGLQEEHGQTATEIVARHLHDRDAIVILDTCEHLLDAAAELATRLVERCPTLRVLATSHEALGVAGEVVYRVPSLPLPPESPWQSLDQLQEQPAVALLLERILAARPDACFSDEQVPALVQICRRLDGLPLALELAAARMRSMSPEQVAARLDDRFKLLKGSQRGISARQQTLRALVDWSFEHLTAEERELACRLAVFRGGFTLEAAIAVAGDEDDPDWDEFEVLDRLTRLVDKSLVSCEEAPGEIRYRMLETVRAYGLDQLDRAGTREQFARRHLECALELATRGREELQRRDAAEWMERLARDHDNFREAMDHCPAGEEMKALDLAVSLVRFWHVRGFLREGVERLERVRLAVQESAPSLELARALNAQANLCHVLGDYREAQGLYARALAIIEEHGDGSGLAGIYANIGIAVRTIGQLDEAETMFEQALLLARKHGQRHNEPAILGNLAGVARQRGWPDRGEELIQEALAAASRLELSEYWTSPIQTVAAELSLSRGRVAEARERAQLARAAYERMGRAAGVAQVHGLLARCAEHEGRIDEAVEHLRAALAADPSTTSSADRANQHRGRAELALLEGRTEEAEAHCRSALELFERMDCRTEAASMYLALGLRSLAKGDLGAAQAELHAALRSYATAQHHAGLCEVLEAIALCALRAGDEDRATRLAALSLERRALGGMNPSEIVQELGALNFPALADRSRETVESELQAVIAALLQGDDA